MYTFIAWLLCPTFSAKTDSLLAHLVQHVGKLIATNVPDVQTYMADVGRRS